MILAQLCKPKQEKKFSAYLQMVTVLNSKYGTPEVFFLKVAAALLKQSIYPCLLMPGIVGSVSMRSIPT